MERHTEEFKKAIAAMLDAEAAKDPLFAEKLANKDKSMDECCDFIISEVEKSGRCGFADSEILGIAKHYWDEDGIKVGEHKSCRVVVNREVQLSEEEKEKARQEAIERLISEEKRKMTERKPKPRQNIENSAQTSLF